MVYGFVKQSHGTVHIYSEPGFGTTVSLYLPIAEDLSLHLPKAIERPRSFDGGATVLVVDDEVDLLEIAVNYLADMGCKAYTAVDGNDALQVLQRENGIDLLVTDIIMPGGMNGVELAHKVREVNPKIKVIYCSGFPADALAARSMPLVDGPLLRKPYQRDELNSLVRRVMATGDGESS
jgi:DNA-binding NtrC family response regulator